jgi:hypothetical protein
MPIRDGKVVGWKHEVNDFKEIVAHEELSVKEKLQRLETLFRDKKSTFNLDNDEFHIQIESLLKEWGHNEEVLEFRANEIIDSIYNYADHHLIWLGI